MLLIIKSYLSFISKVGIYSCHMKGKRHLLIIIRRNLISLRVITNTIINRNNTNKGYNKIYMLLISIGELILMMPYMASSMIPKNKHNTKSISNSKVDCMAKTWTKSCQHPTSTVNR